MITRIGFALSLALLSSTALASGAVSNNGHQRGIAATQFQVTNLISNQDGMAPNTDPSLVNPWGIAQEGTGPLWVSNNGSSTSTVYQHKTGVKQPLTVNIPDGSSPG